MRMATICSGIGAPEVASTGLGFTHEFMAEIEAFPSAVLAHHWPHVPNLGDMTKIDGEAWRGKVDVLVGGTPCQAFSVAGKRESLNDERGNLTLKFVELCDAINPAYVVWENVPGVLSTADNAFGCFLGALSGNDGELFPAGDGWSNAGCVIGPRRKLAWRILDAQYFGLAQRRRRVFVVACPRDGADPCEILFEREGVQRHSAPSREKGEGFASDVALCLRAGGNRTGGDRPYGTDVDTCDSLLPVAFHPTQDPIHSADGSCHALGCGSGGGQSTHAVAFGGDLARTLQARHDSSACHDRGMDVIATNMQVRRLTPIECERLQGFPDGYTAIPWRKGKLDAFISGKDCPDGPRYKALGNSMAVPVMRWILRRVVDEG